MALHFERARPDTLETLHPAYFAMVMATGILAISAFLHAVPVAPAVLFWLNAFFLAALSAAFAARAIRRRAAFAADLKDHSRAVGFFTIVAALGVFGDELIIQMGAVHMAALFLVAAGVLLVLLTYGILAVLTVKPEKPPFVSALNGGWLVCVVAIQATANLTVLAVSQGDFPAGREVLMFSALALWLAGGAVYIWISALIFFRYAFLPMRPDDLTPPYWINMGAVAITALAGTSLGAHAALSPVVSSVLPFVKGFTLFYWAIGAWWIPLLLCLGVWRYILRGAPVSYDPLYWSAVFPLGMFSVATYRLTGIFDAPFLAPVADAFLIAAAVAWIAAFAGLLDSLAGRFRRAVPAGRK